MDDYESNKNDKQEEDDDKDEQYEYSDGNLSNVFNLEGEDCSQRY